MTKKRIVKKCSSVSLVTITQLIRSDCLLNLLELIKLQTYKNIIEWVIVEGSKTKEDADINKEKISKIESPVKIVYVEYTGKRLSDLRNLSNDTCTGDIIVCMDDDDYYPPDRVEHAVESLEKSSCLIAGCSDIYMYEYFMGKLYKFKGFHQNHSTNNCMAYKKEYLKNHRYESNLIMSEEKSFTNNFSEPMVQLISKKCIIVSSHDFNTFNKRELCVGGTIGINPTLYEVNDHPITNYIPTKIFNRMKSLFYHTYDDPYDIVYYTGGFSNKWVPTDKSLGGSEQAIVNLAEYWASIGKKVIVYADNEKEMTHNLVEYKNWKKLPFNHKFKNIILWRNNGFISAVPFELNAENIFWDLHDNFSGDDKITDLYKKYGNKITKVLLKSNYHKEAFESYFKTKLKDDQYVIIPNGILVDKFSKNIENVTRNPYRFCYVSYYTRGLQHIIPHIWYIIKQLEPRAELHLYYGMEMFNDENLKNQLKALTCFPGVIDHGRQSIDMIVREKYMSSFQLYITNTIAEIDCISIRESLVAGCIPLISNFGVFKEREGIHFELKENEEHMKNIAIGIVNLLKDQKQIDILRNAIKKSPTILSWEDCGKQYLSLFNT
jgi:glycosyltransferase involved in cell wall biosynthesis